MKKSIISATLAASILMLSATSAQAGYYQHNDELRKSGQTTEEAKHGQKHSHHKAMKGKHQAFEKDHKSGKEGCGDKRKFKDSKKEHHSYGHKHKKFKEIIAEKREKRAEYLGLTDQQKSSLDEIYAESDAFMAEKRKEMKAFKKKQYEKFRNILTDEQKEEMDAAKEKRMKKFRKMN